MTGVFEKDTIGKFQQVFSQRGEILAVYVFGSRVNGFANSQSDLDMAVFVSDREKISEREILRLLANNGVSTSFSLDLSCVDFDSPPIFLYEIIKNGVCVYEKENDSRATIEGEILDIYYDNQHMRNIYGYYLNESLKKGVYGH
ncbi:MAG: nucleotidyltransferase domain-containing protein [bacterium]|nr:nucleotidyltransferase domain-containing protein [bacterium]